VAQPRLAMQKIKDVLRLHLLGGVGSCRQLARAVGCGKSAVADCLRRAKVANLSDWAVVAELDEAELSRRLYSAAGVTGRTTTKASRQSRSRDSSVRPIRVTGSIRRGLTPRSMWSASWRRKNRFSALID
jgi:hypothetical protein